MWTWLPWVVALLSMLLVCLALWKRMREERTAREWADSVLQSAWDRELVLHQMLQSAGWDNPRITSEQRIRLEALREKRAGKPKQG